MKHLVYPFYLLFIVFGNYCQSQITKSTTELQCDSIVFKNGDVVIGRISQVKRKRIIYIMCCEECAVPRELDRSLVDTIIYNPVIKSEEINDVSIEHPAQKEVVQQIEAIKYDSVYCLRLSHLEKNLFGNKEIKILSRVIIKTNDSIPLKIKGRLAHIGADTLYITKSKYTGNIPVAFDKVHMIKKPIIAAQIIGVVGGIVSVPATAIFLAFGEPYGLAFPSIFAMTFVRTKYDMKKGWTMKKDFLKMKKVKE